MCMAFSGRCLLSNYLTDAAATTGLRTALPLEIHVVEEKRPGRFFPVEENGGVPVQFAGYEHARPS